MPAAFELTARDTISDRVSRPEPGIPAWLGGYLLLLPLGIPLFTYLVPSDLCLAFGLAAGIAGHIKRPALRFPEPRAESVFPAAALAFAGFCLLGSLVSGQPGAVAFELVSIGWLALGAWMISRAIPTRDAWDTAVQRFNLLFLPVLLFCVAGLATHWAGWDEWTGGVFSFRLYLPFRFPILLGAYLIAAHPFAVAWSGAYIAKRAIYNILYIITVSGVGARSCMLVAIGQVVWSELRPGADEKPVLPGWLRLALALTAFGTISLLLVDEFSFQRSFGLSGVPALAQDLPRERQLDRALTHLADMAVGIGPGCFRAIHGEELHNTPLNLLVETGLGGFLTAHAILLAALLPVIRSLRAGETDARRRAAALISAVAGLYLLGLFHNLLRNRFVWLVLALALAWPNIPAGDTKERPWT